MFLAGIPGSSFAVLDPKHKEKQRFTLKNSKPFPQWVRSGGVSGSSGGNGGGKTYKIGSFVPPSAAR